MCEHLDKAKAALEAAREHEKDHDQRKVSLLLAIAGVQAEVSQAESLARIAVDLHDLRGWFAPSRAHR